MMRSPMRNSGRRPRWRRAAPIVAALALGHAGCSQFGPAVSAVTTTPPVIRAASAEIPTQPVVSDPKVQVTLVRQAQAEQPATPEVLPAPVEPGKPPAAPAATATHLPDALAVAEHPTVPVGLDTVFRLAEDQNAQVGIARQRVQEALAEKAVAKYKWLPDLYVGTAFYRHEGGIQNEDGTLTHSSTGALFAGMEIDGVFDVREVAYQQVTAQRRVWQQRGELSRITSETLLDAANAYIDLLAVRSGEIIARDLEVKLRELRDRAQRLAQTEPAARVQVARIQAELEGQQQTVARLKSQAAGLQAKLIYLLGLDPCSELVPVDRQLVPFDAVDATAPLCTLVSQALTNGPGVREMEGLLALIQQSIDRYQGAAKYMPIFELRMAEGAFGAGPGEDWNWDNRWDLGLQARWNLTERFTLKDRQRVNAAKIQQAYLANQDLRAKLTAGVQEARETILNGREQIGHTEQQVKDASEAFDLSRRRVRELQQPTTYTESLLAIDSLARAQMNYIGAINAYDKAQIRLVILLGPGASPFCKPHDAP